MKQLRKEIAMNSTDFLNKLQNISHAYKWGVYDNKLSAKIQSGPNRGFTLNPVTALAHKSGFGVFENTRDGTECAASLLGIPRRIARQIYSATIGSNNHGNTQVFRGRIRSALEV